MRTVAQDRHCDTDRRCVSQQQRVVAGRGRHRAAGIRKDASAMNGAVLIRSCHGKHTPSRYFALYFALFAFDIQSRGLPIFCSLFLLITSTAGNAVGGAIIASNTVTLTGGVFHNNAVVAGTGHAQGGGVFALGQVQAMAPC